MANDRDESRRALARRQVRTAGDRSARVANTLMKVSASTITKLDLDDELREAIESARAVKSLIARRRAERALAGELRRIDLRDLETRLANVQATGSAEPRLFHLAEQWRERLIAEGTAAAAEFPGGNQPPLPTLIHQARRERDTGKPPGAARALFRHVLEVLKAEPAGEDADPAVQAGDTDDDELDDDDE